jgi:predicted DNA-binding transcriptional regulator AlpA
MSMNGFQAPSAADATGMKAQRRILHSWKEIASYVGRGVRTIQRYEVQLGLPVHRLAGSRSAVMAFSDEIDAWLNRTPTRYQRMIDLVVEASEMRSNTVLNGNRVSNAIDTCPLCWGTGKISNQNMLNPDRDRSRFHKQKIKRWPIGCVAPKQDP